MKISEDVQAILNSAYMDAKNRGSEYITPEHVMYAALLFESAIALLKKCGADPKQMKEEISTHIDESIPVLQGSEPAQTVGFQGVIERVYFHSQTSASGVVEVSDLLVSLFDENESYASYVMKNAGITRLILLKVVTESGEESEPEDVFPPEEEHEQEGKGSLKKYTRDLTEEAEQGLLEPIIGRKDVMDQVVQVLCRKLKNNPVMIGDPGVGKTALAEGIAQRLASGEVPERLKGFRMYSLNIGGLISGTRFRGDFEERLENIIKELLKVEKCILFIDEIHSIVGAGAVSSGTVDAASMLKPVLTTGKMRCIGSSTYDEYKKYFEKDRALARRFQKVEIQETTTEETIKILQGLKPRFEDFHNITIRKRAIEAAVHLSNEHINERFQPDKAIDVLDETGAYLQMQSYKGSRTLKTLDTKHIEHVVAKIANIPDVSVSMSEKVKLQYLERDLLSVIFGQNEAVRQVVDAVKRSRAGFQLAEKPVASLLFAGPTGVGKTELAKQLANHLAISLHRFDMSEYQEKHTVSRLIGSPPGYVGYDEGGLLTDAIRKTPHAVLLLDEIEKAHKDIYNVLLQVMDSAVLTDNAGRKADFKNVIIIMTSNAGARQVGQPIIGFEEQNISSSAITEAIERIFEPEFRNRLDKTVIFNPLGENEILRIVDKEISEFKEQLAEKKVELTVTDKCRTWLAKTGYSPEYGARNLRRLIQDKIKTFFVDAVLFGKLENGGSAQIDIKDDDVVISTRD